MNCNSGLPVAIRRARPEELGQIMGIVADAAAFMHANGNPGQWRDGYPGRERIAADIAGGYSHAAIDATGTMVATFCFMPSPEPNYATIRDGAWQDGSPYHVIHRLACDGTGPGHRRPMHGMVSGTGPSPACGYPPRQHPDAASAASVRFPSGRHRLRGGRHTAHRFRTQRQLLYKTVNDRRFRPIHRPFLLHP